MNRRTFLCGLTLGMLSVPLGSESQQAGKVWRIGLLSLATSEATAPLLRSLDEGLRDLGYVEGGNIRFERRYAGGRFEKLPELAAELVRQRVDVIVAPINAEIAALKRATSTIPVVMVHAVDPVGSGFISSLARPGGNITGLSFWASTETLAKHLEMPKELIPNLSRVAVLRQAEAGSAEHFAGFEAASKKLGLILDVVDVRGLDDFESAFATIIGRRSGALLVYGGPLTWMRRQQIADFALKNRLPGIHSLKEYAQAGLLITYGPSLPGIWRNAAVYIDRILKGAKPADLPVEQPTNFELVINLKTAKALGLTIPQSLLIRADQLIE